jgi:serine/threonine protein kinase
LKYSNGAAMKDEKHAYRTLTEAFLLHKLSHPNIIKVVDFYEDNYDGFCSVMEYNKCYTLKEIIEDC